jgi:hypothetical protein
MNKIIILMFFMALGTTVCAQNAVSDRGYLYREYSDDKIYCEDGVLLINSSHNHILVKFPQNKNVSSYTIPSKVSVIAKGAFQGNKYIKIIKIPSSVKYVGDNAFADCDNLQSIEIYETSNATRAIEADNTSLETKEIGRYNIQGVKVQEDDNGMVQIILYSDGTSKKILK